MSADPARPAPIASWLFLRRSESVWVERYDAYTMVVAGPGRHHETRVFEDEDALEDFQMALAGQLTAAGWFLAAFDYERRRAADRRGEPRPSDDRRQRLGRH
jgi:hypothetical protein